MKKKNVIRGKWGSHIGFVLATAGAAVGLGNIQRFPYITAENGGAGFVLIYILCTLVLGVPLVLMEFAIGRHSHKNPVDALKILAPKTKWYLVGFFCILTAFFILSYYSVVGGWAIHYTLSILFNNDVNFQQFTSDPFSAIVFMAIFILIVMFIVGHGVKKGIEAFCKISMPILLILLIILIIKSLFMENSAAGLKYYLMPDFSKITGKTVLLALTQSFFSLCIGEAVLITYGSYTTKKEDLFKSAIYVVIFDTLIAILAGLAIFPALFSFNVSPDQGVGLSFIILPQIFQQMPFGTFVGALFFLLLSIAALTTGVALLEMPVIYLIDAKKWERKKAVLLTGLLAFLIGLPSALSKGAIKFLTEMHFSLINQHSFYDIMDFLWGGLGMVICGCLLAIFTGWKWKIKNAVKEINISSPSFRYYKIFWSIIIKYIAPIGIILILLNLFKL